MFLKRNDAILEILMSEADSTVLTILMQSYLCQYPHSWSSTPLSPTVWTCGERHEGCCSAVQPAMPRSVHSLQLLGPAQGGRETQPSQTQLLGDKVEKSIASPLNLRMPCSQALQEGRRNLASESCDFPTWLSEQHILEALQT